MHLLGKMSQNNASKKTSLNAHRTADSPLSHLLLRQQTATVPFYRLSFTYLYFARTPLPFSHSKLGQWYTGARRPFFSIVFIATRFLCCLGCD